jgi:hypothetical protein
MSQLTALYFPDTALTTQAVSQELLFFEKILFYQPVEVDPEASSPEGLDLCSGYPPVPFNEDLDRFKALLRDLKGHAGEFYSGQLSSMALEYMESRDGAEVKNLISSITKTKDTTEQETKTYEALWQSRLLLKLAEIMAVEEKDLQNELSAIAQKEEVLFDVLKGDLELARSLHPQTSRPTSLPVRPEIILKAWGQLFLADKKETPWTLATGESEYGESFFEASEALSGQRPIRLCRIPLPHTEGLDTDAYTTKRNLFRKDGEKTLGSFTRLLEETAQSGQQESTIKDWAGMAAKLTRLVADSGTWGQPSLPVPQPHLEIYLCSQSLHKLLAHFCRSTTDTTANEPKHGIIAIKSSKKIECN